MPCSAMRLTTSGSRDRHNVFYSCQIRVLATRGEISTQTISEAPQLMQVFGQIVRRFLSATGHKDMCV